MSSIPISIKKGNNFLPEDELGIGEPVWDHAHPLVHRIGGGSGGVNPRFYPGVDASGNLFMEMGTKIKPFNPQYRETGWGWEGNELVVRIDGAVAARINALGLQVTGGIQQSATDPTYLPSRTGLAELLFPLFGDKTLIAQFNRPAFAAVDASNKFHAYRDAGTFLGDFSSYFTRGGSGDVGQARFVNGSLNYDLSLNNQPRIQYSFSTGKCRGLLVEPPATNLVTYSYGLNQWSVQNNVSVTATPNTAWANKGLNAPFNIVETGGTAEHSIGQNISGLPNQPLAASLFFSPNAFTGIRRFTVFVATPDRTQMFGATFEIDAGQAPFFYGSRNAGNGQLQFNEVEAVGGGLYRIKIVGLVNPSASNAPTPLQVFIASLGDSPTNTNLVFLPNAAAANWGLFNDVQVEQNNFVTSYIQTVSVTLTRNQDVLSLNLANFHFSSLEGTFEFGFRADSRVSAGALLFSVSDPNGANRVDYFIAANDTTNKIYTIGSTTYRSNVTPVTNNNVATTPYPRSKFTLPYANLPSGLTNLIVDGSKGFFGTVSLISYE